MSALVSPIHVGIVGLGNLRFFAPPDGAREFPWLSIDDLHACLTLPRSLRREFKAKLRTSQWKDDAHTVATVDGIVNIVPHFVAQGLIDALRDVGQIGDGIYGEYARQGAKALGALTKGMPPDRMMDYIKDAWAAAGGSPK